MGEYKHGKQTKAMLKEEFYKIMEHGHFVKRMHRAFLVLLYYSGCRISEILELTPSNFNLVGQTLYAKIPAKKGGINRGAFKLDLTLPYVNEVIERLKRVRSKRLIFPMTRQTGWLVVKRVAAKKYPYYFRLNRTVHFLNNPSVTLNEIREWMAWKKIETVNNYLGYSERTTEKLSKELE